jgi:hypothetical protein
MFSENSHNNIFGHEQHEYEGFEVLHHLLSDLAMLSDLFLHKFFVFPMAELVYLT